MIHLLPQAASTTRHSDRALTELGVAAALFELVSAQEASIYRVQPAGRFTLLERVTLVRRGELLCRDTDFEMPESSCKLETRPEMETCVTGEQIVALEIPDGTQVVHCIPVAFDGKVAAVVELVCGRILEPDELAAAGPLVEFYRNYLSRIDDTERDALTGLLNRSTFDHNLDRILAMISAPQGPDSSTERRASPDLATPHWLAIIDIDHFKRINEKFGQLYGDEVLTLLANLMRESFRHRDRLFRFGGDALVAVLRPAAFEDVNRALERFRSRVEAQSFPQVGKVSVSIGLAAIASGDTAEDVLGAAEEALRHAKSNGRNRTSCYEKLLAAGEIKKRAAGGDAGLF